ncbi:MAG: hypothetical protein HN742_37755 [Lentisphaerae bacterium]|jgi:hypothetical protein|nr:hypothetical protein [Lentisphaerota bacterium]MBT4821693.1 hypothetical protein [Lentisphaerota bacterium]MBT5608147.1 hypothetical protein [Lentisphaerota bacterium]MBT7058695.1 hypothetical protein [Lentisphaerota bacterium]MBT7847675.1 hypothetical protein [Lentisphaerota bacterium]
MRTLVTRLILAVGVVGPSCIAAQKTLHGFSHAREINTSQVARELIVAVPLDDEVCARTRTDSADLRVVDDLGQEVPYLLRKETETRQVTCEEPVPMTVRGLRELVGNRVAITAERVRMEGASPSILVVHTHLRDFEKLVRVSGRTAGGNWTVIAEGQTIFDYHRFMDVSGSRIHLRSGNFREFQVEVSDVTDVGMSTCVKLAREIKGGEVERDLVTTVLKRRDFRIDRLEFLRLATREKQRFDRTVEQAPLAMTIAQDTRDRETEMTVTFVGQPLCGLELVPTSRNFHRDARIEVERGRGQGQGWAELRRGTITSLALGGYEKTSLRLTFPETRGKRYRVTVTNNDAPPIDISGIIGIGKVYRLLFLASPERTYRLLFGRPDGDVPVYDSGHVLRALLREGDVSPTAVALGPVTENPAFSPGFRAFALLGTRAALTTAIIIAVLALGGAIYHAARNVEKMADDA